MADGLIDLEDLKRAIDKDTILVSIMYANNEIGVVQPHQGNRRHLPRAQRALSHGRGTGRGQDPRQRHH